MTLTVGASVNGEENYFIPGTRAGKAGHSDPSAAAAHPAVLEVLEKLHQTQISARELASLCERLYSSAAGGAALCPSRAVCLSLTLTHRTASTRFPPRRSQSPTTKPPHWEDSVDVTGGVNRRGGVTLACGSARFRRRRVQKRPLYFKCFII